MNISDEAVEAAAKAFDVAYGVPYWSASAKNTARAIIEASAPHIAAQRAVDAVVMLHREMPCLDEEGDPVGGSYCEECKDLDDHTGERVHEVYPCMTVREIRKALAGKESYASMRDRIEAPYRSAGAGE